MDNYKEMYYKLFNRVSDVISELKTVQQETEEMYLLQEQIEKVIPINLPDKNKKR